VVAVLTLRPLFGEFASLAASDIAGVLPPMAAGAFALFAAGRAVDQVRLAWFLIGVGCLAWALGETTWTVYEVGLRQEIPFPSFADVGYLAMLPLTALGLALLSGERRRWASYIPALDGVALVLAFTAFVWFFVLHPTYAASGAGILEKVIGGAYPLGDLVMAYALAVAARRQWGYRDGIVLMMLLGGVLLLVGADVGFAYLTLEDRYTSEHLVNLGWPFGFLCIAYAAALGPGWDVTFAGEPDGKAPHAWRQALPVGLVPPMAALAVLAFRSESLATSLPLAVMVGIAGAAVLARLAVKVGLAREVNRSRERVVVWLEEWRDRKAA